MGEFHRGLKWVFILFNAFIWTAGFLLFVLMALVLSHTQHVAWLSIVGLCVTALLCITTPTFGFIAVAKEKRSLLKSYCLASVTVVTSVLSLSFAVYRQSRHLKSDTYMWELKSAVMSSNDHKATLNRLENQAECCGILTYSDWGDNIPQSCECLSSFLSADCTDVWTNQRLISIYNKPCGPVITYFLQLGVNLVFGLLYGIAALALICMLLAVALLKVAHCCPLELL